MRLRYLHLPRCGPLIDTAIVFGRDELISEALDLPRLGSLNFVVGVNGSGKSSLLRALYQIFRALKNGELPPMPVTVAWDVSPGDQTVTALLHSPEDKKEEPYFIALEQVPSETSKASWLQQTTNLKGDLGAVNLLRAIKRGDAVLGSYLQAHLPKKLIAYTSGADDSWVRVEQPVFHPKDEDEGQFQIEDERPHGWSIDQECQKEQPLRITSVLTRSAQVGEIAPEALGQLMQEFAPLNVIRGKVLTNQQVRTERLDDSYFRIFPRHLRFAGITLALLQAAKELSDHREYYQRKALRIELLRQLGSKEKPKDARRVLNELDWFWPTHLSITYHDDVERVSPRQHQELLCLVALADEVIAQPLGRYRAVISLGPSDRINLTEKLEDAFPLGVPGKGLEFIAERVNECKTGAEAVLRVLSADKDIDSTPMDVFSRLRDWERTGLLEDITLTIKRIRQHDNDDEDPGDVLVAYDQLSDGEQMLLGRMGLLFLLRGQNGSLLLLDEPETHFNDVWKREIVEMVDLGLLNSTKANVILATHTSIALTDAFASEVTVLDKDTETGETAAKGVSGGLFGTDPGEVTVNLFRADSGTGSRSVELLNQLLKTDWKGKESKLEAILNVLGSSFHRAELRALLKQLRANDYGASSC